MKCLLKVEEKVWNWGEAETETLHEEPSQLRLPCMCVRTSWVHHCVLIEESRGHLSKTHDVFISHLVKVTTWDWTRAEKTFSVYEIMCKILKVGAKSSDDCKGFAWLVGVQGSQPVYEDKQCLDMKENKRWRHGKEKHVREKIEWREIHIDLTKF